MRRPFLAALAIVTIAFSVVVAPALAYAFPSTNDANRANGHPHVNEVDVGIGMVTLEFVNDTNSLAYFEVRVDGESLNGYNGGPHPVVTGDFIHGGVSLDSRGIGTPVVVAQTFFAEQTVEVRLALGGERSWDFDWVAFDVLPDVQTKDDCKNGGWANYGFSNQGLCIQFVNTGKDSRAG